jgi:hypothetical protein
MASLLVYPEPSPRVNIMSTVSTPPRTLRVAVAVLCTIILTACGSGSTSGPPSTATAVPALSPSAAGARESGAVAGYASDLRKSGFTPDYHITVPVQGGETLYVFHSLCTGSADGHCHSVDVFTGAGRKPVWHKDYVGVFGLQPAKDGFQVRATSYARGDKLCCPSELPVIDTYTWNGHAFTESGPLPKAPSG